MPTDLSKPVERAGSSSGIRPARRLHVGADDQQGRFSYIFAWELHERLLWFSNLRWVAVAGLALASFFGPVFAMPSTHPSLAVVALLVGAYNLVFIYILRARLGPEEDYANLRIVAILQMVTDLAALFVTVHFTGGCASPVLPFVVFHMAIGTIMIETRAMWVLAFAACGAAACLFVFEHIGVLARYPTVAGGQPSVGSCVLGMAMLVGLVFGVVYLTDSVTSRFMARNIELYETTRKLRRALDEQELLERRKSHYMRISAHQLRSPLGTIKTSIQVLLDGYIRPGSPEGHRMLEGTAARVDSLLAIVNDLLELAKMREGRAKAPWTRKVSINQILADIFDAVDPIAREANVELVPYFIEEGAAILDWAVPPDLVYAFENLIHNAIKYSKPEGGTVSVALAVDGSKATVIVADEGSGIHEELQDDVFLEFVRAPNAKHVEAEVTGLGLSIVREAVQMHGGEVSIESAEGVGTTVSVVVPLHWIPPEVEQLSLIHI